MDGEIVNTIAKQIPGIEEKWQEYGLLFKEETIPAKTILLREGEVARRMFFIEKGVIRLFFNDFKKDVTVQFFFEGSLVCSMESFLEHKPSKFSLETLENGVYYSLDRESHARLMQDIPNYQDHFQHFLGQRMFHYLNRCWIISGFHPKSATIRY